MRFSLDQNRSPKLAELQRQAGHDAHTRWNSVSSKPKMTTFSSTLAPNNAS